MTASTLAIGLLLAAACGFLCTGCSVVRTMEPLWLAADPQTAAQIAGEWRGPSDPTMRVSIETLNDSGSVGLYLEEEKVWSAYIGRALVLGEVRILEVNLATIREKDAPQSTLQGFTFFRIVTTDGRLRFQHLSDERVERVVQAAGVGLSRSPGCEDEAKPASGGAVSSGPVSSGAESGDPRSDRTSKSEVCYLTIEGEPRRIADLFRNHATGIFDPGEPDDDEGLIRMKAE